MSDFLTEMDLKMSESSFPYFFEKILGYELADFHQEWLDLVNNTSRTVIICSRDHGKSVFFHSWCVWQLCFQEPPYQMLYISSNHKQTMVHMKDIDRMFTNIPQLKRFKPRGGWAVGAMRLTNGNEILERSVGSQIRGLHPQEIIIDDPLKEFSMTAIQRVTDWFWGDMIPTLHHTASLRMVGTPFTYTDIFVQLEENPAYTVARYPAIKQDGTALWPNRWSLEMLEERKMEIGASKFTREYICVPISTNTMLFAPDAIKACKNSYASLESVAREGFQYYIGYDPAISANGDYTVMMVLEVDENMNKQVVHMLRAQGLDFREHIQHIMELCRRYRPEIVMIETNTFAKAFAMELKSISDFPVKEFTMSRKKKEEIILNLQMNIDNGKIVLPTQNENSRGVTNMIVQELGAFGINAHGKIEGVGAHDDIVIALALANYATKTFTDTFLDIDSGGMFNSPTPLGNKGGAFHGINF
jgi:hypothetical protein